jgi:hypothetical protein
VIVINRLCGLIQNKFSFKIVPNPDNRFAAVAGLGDFEIVLAQQKIDPRFSRPIQGSLQFQRLLTCHSPPATQTDYRPCPMNDVVPYKRGINRELATYFWVHIRLYSWLILCCISELGERGSRLIQGPRITAQDLRHALVHVPRLELEVKILEFLKYLK